MAEAGALAGLGSDLAFTISFAISRELLDGAAEAGMSQDELISIVLALGIVFAALPKTLASFGKEVAAWWASRQPPPKADAAKAQATPSAAGTASGGGSANGGGGVPGAGGGTPPHVRDPSGLTELFRLLPTWGSASPPASACTLASSTRAKQSFVRFGSSCFSVWCATSSSSTRRRGSKVRGA